MRGVLLGLVVLLCFGAPLRGQYTVKKIQFPAMGDYSQADLEAAAGLHAGQSLSPAQLGVVAQRLADTACFENIEATLEGAVKAVTVVVKFKPVAQTAMLRAGFRNFVWYTPEELTAYVHGRVPLFHGYVPEAGNQMDAVQAALQAALAAKSVQGTATHLLREAIPGGSGGVVDFLVDGHRVVVGSVALSGSPAPPEPPQAAPDAGQRVARPIAGRAYSEGLLGQTTADAVLTPWLEAGYADARLTNVERALTETAAVTTVGLKATVVAGEVYRVSAIHFAGTPLESAAEFEKTETLHAGDVASRTALRKTLAPLEAAYRKQGYMDVAVDAGPVLDEGARQVAYTVTVVPGEQYRVRSVTPLGLSPAAQADFDRGWRMKAGELYDAEYVASFLGKNTALLALAHYSAGFKASADPETHLVDLTIQFVRGPGAR